MEANKKNVHDFWNEAACGETLLMKGESLEEQFRNQMKKRYELEPYILDFAGFESAKGKKVLEIGVGLGADHQMFAQHGADLYGVDLTEKAVSYTRQRLRIFGLDSKLATGDAEKLQFPDSYFDKVYSWGVIHHSPQTPKAVQEIFRILKPGGEAKVMIYHTYSLVGYMLWLRYALLKFRPFTSLKSIYDRYLESPGTKAYSKKEARKLFGAFKEVDIRIELSHGDLLSDIAGQRHQGPLLRLARMLWPRNFVRRALPGQGLFMLISAKKG